jgi:hypothetical protein
MSGYVVIVTRLDPDDIFATFDDRVIIVGPFRTRERADQRAAVIRRLADRYEDPEGVTGPDNALMVEVRSLASGRSSAQHVLDVIYGSVAA